MPTDAELPCKGLTVLRAGRCLCFVDLPYADKSSLAIRHPRGNPALAWWLARTIILLTGPSHKVICISANCVHR